MALCDYRLCDVCESKAFYDANLDYQRPSEDQPAYRLAGQTQPFNSLGRVGDWAVLCTDCAKTHRTAIVKIEGGEQA